MYKRQDYETDIPTEVSKDIREQMWEEQRGLCAYCMKKIKNSSVMRIEQDVYKRQEYVQKRLPVVEYQQGASYLL